MPPNRAELKVAAKAAAAKTGRYALKTLWYTTVTITCPIWCPILGGCYAWDVHHNGRSRHGLNSEKWRYRQTQRHKRNRKVRAKPLLLQRNALEAAVKTCEREGKLLDTYVYLSWSLRTVCSIKGVAAAAALRATAIMLASVLSKITTFSLVQRAAHRGCLLWSRAQLKRQR